MSNKENFKIGYDMGVVACKNNKPRVPAADKNVMEYIQKNSKEVGSSIPLLKGWIAGYEWQIDQDLKADGFYKDTAVKPSIHKALQDAPAKDASNKSPHKVPDHSQ